ncbi:MAG: DMT family transporter [Nitrospinaceae bacterium]|nr:DMT family transporter [Nitrospinaceae bacterium]MBT3432523.1 DMT family transporter [Nitrospinaceae bacterium]MBT4429212.1 DMT family transporter [Nitrospinaceae bacterium]MBT5367077.1 DMT family transporter [Nitrospinaceae bacterium]MBT6393822.1 DMT family transporter [Nitrospinaceae bacterium]
MIEGGEGTEAATKSGTVELVAGCTSLVIVWGLTQPVIKAAYAGLSPFALIWLRAALSALTLTVWMLVMRVPDRVTHTNPRAELGHRILNGILHNAYILFLYIGMTSTQAARASILLYTQPVWVMLFAALVFPGERITPRRALGFGAAMAGTVVIFAQRLAGQSELWADSFLVIAAVLWAVQAIHFKRFLSGSDMFAVTRWAMLIGTPLYLALSLLTEDGGRYAFGAAEIYAVFHMGVISSGLILVLWAHLMLKHSPARVSVFLFLTPAVGVAASAIILGESLGWNLLAGAVLTISGVWLVTVEGRKSLSK